MSGEIAVRDAGLLDTLQPSDGWLIVDHCIRGGTLYQTHYLCAACLADLTELRVHHVIACPYCTADLPFLLDAEQKEKPHAQFVGDWPYDLLGLRFPDWCTWHGVMPGDQGEPIPGGGRQWIMQGCRLPKGHAEPCEFGPGRVPNTSNPLLAAVIR